MKIRPAFVTYAERISFHSSSGLPQMIIADLAFRFAPVFSLAEQASVSASLRVSAQAPRYFVFPAVAPPAFLPIDWPVFQPDASLASTLVWPQVAVSRQAGELPVGAGSAGDSLVDVPTVAVLLLVAVLLPVSVAPRVGDSCFVREWPPVYSVGAPLAWADSAQFPAVLRLCVHPPVDFPLDDWAPHDSPPDGSRCHVLAPLRAQE